MTSQRRPPVEAEVEHLDAAGLSQRPYDPALRRDWRLLGAVYDTFYRNCVAPAALRHRHRRQLPVELRPALRRPPGDRSPTAVNSTDLTLSVVSHGQVELIQKLLSDLDALPGLAGVHVVLTLNIPELEPRWQDYTRLRIQVIRNTAPQGFGHNHNAAFAHCRTRYFTVLNPDLRFPSDPFPRLLQALRDDPDATLAAPRVLNSAGGDEDSVREMLTPWSLLRRRLSCMRTASDQVAQRRGFWVAGMFLLFVADDYRRLGGFDQRFFMYCEDFELCLRVHIAHRRILVVSDASVVHDARRDSHRSLRHLRWHLASLLRVWMSTSFLRVVSGIR